MPATPCWPLLFNPAGRCYPTAHPRRLRRQQVPLRCLAAKFMANEGPSMNKLQCNPVSRPLLIGTPSTSVSVRPASDVTATAVAVLSRNRRPRCNLLPSACSQRHVTVWTCLSSSETGMAFHISEDAWACTLDISSRGIRYFVTGVGSSGTPDLTGGLGTQKAEASCGSNARRRQACFAAAAGH